MFFKIDVCNIVHSRMPMVEKQYLRLKLILIGFILAWVILACGAMPLAAGAPPAEALATPTLSLAPAAAAVPTASLPPPIFLLPLEVPGIAAVTPQPAIQESRHLTLEWPPVIRAGDADTIRLTLEVDDNGNLTPTAEIEGHVTTGQTVNIPSLYDTHNVVAEACLDLAGMRVVPSETASQPLRPGQSVTFYWSVRSAEAGKFRGVVWFYLRFVPLAGGLESERTVSAQTIEIEVVSFIGLRAGPARLLGLAGAFLSSVLGLPFLEDSLRWLWKRVKGANSLS